MSQRNYDSLDTFFRLGVLKGLGLPTEEVANVDAAMAILYRCEIEVYILTTDPTAKQEGIRWITRTARRLGQRLITGAWRDAEELYRLTGDDLDRLVNAAKPATELGWAVKDLLLAHYELDGLRQEQADRITPLRRINAELYAHASALMTALQKSVELQSHYASLLNMHDGGTRLQFGSAQEWIDRVMPAPKTATEAARSSDEWTCSHCGAQPQKGQKHSPECEAGCS